jgi:excisionase family DNA binding protein
MTKSKVGGGFGTKPLISVGEAAILLGITRSTAYRAIATNSFPVPIIQVGGRRRVSREALRRLIDGEEHTEACNRNRQRIGSTNYVSTASQGPPETETCPACGCERSASVQRTASSSEPMCSAARRSSSGTASV